jgi:hypothetical protein
VSAQVWSPPAAIAVIGGLTADGDDVVGGVVAGAGLVADAQAPTSKPTTIVVTTRKSKERIRCSSRRCVA